ncbi:MAG: hypothetical protein DWQ01_11185 [Planctomycetota bacterium]|nr:MAG: hypothetical protein DWQ01_11185 [Planctomycetota bacterium]
MEKEPKQGRPRLVGVDGLLAYEAPDDQLPFQVVVEAEGFFPRAVTFLGDLQEVVRVPLPPESRTQIQFVLDGEPLPEGFQVQWATFIEPLCLSAEGDPVPYRSCFYLLWSFRKARHSGQEATDAHGRVWLPLEWEESEDAYHEADAVVDFLILSPDGRVWHSRGETIPKQEEGIPWELDLLHWDQAGA